jgi:hypothetical protein
MISLVFGLIVFAASLAALKYFMPRDGVVHRLAIIPVMDSVIPVCIVSGMAVGTALAVAGAVSLG